ncbi:MAG TPA: hypothetical protein VGL09_09465 [Methylomirabilota bacterium]|jgi:hypothetical protein
MRHRACTLAAGLLLVAQLGGGLTPSSKAADQIDRASRQPLPKAPPPAATSPAPLWVPDRIIAVPGESPSGLVRVPGHWEYPRDNGRVFVPPLTVCNSQTGECRTEPAGVKRPVDERQSP